MASANDEHRKSGQQEPSPAAETHKQDEKLRATMKDEDLAKVPQKARITFIVLGAICFFELYAMRVIISVAMVSMVKSGGGEYDWSEATQGVILSSFFWGYIWTQIPSGILVKFIGGKWVLLMGTVITAILTAATPIAASISYTVLIVTRVVMGLAEGFTIPAMHHMIAQWAPPFQRSRFAAIIYGGGTAGLVVSQPIAGLLSQSSLGWQSVFYLFGFIGIGWGALWAFMVYENPDSHKWISDAERKFIKDALGGQVDMRDKKESPKLPWSSIFRSMPFWAIVVAHFGLNWGFYTLLTILPTYVKNVLGFNIGAAGVISALPYLCLYVVSITGSIIADKVRQSGKLSTTAVRKIATATAFCTAGTCLVIVSFLGPMVTLVVAMISVAGAGLGLTYSGFNVNHVDIAPNYAGTLIGFTNCAGTIPGIVAPFVNGKIIDRDQHPSKWRIVFLISAGVYYAATLFYVLFASGEEQPWNRNHQKQSEEGEPESGTLGQETLQKEEPNLT